MMFRGIAMAVFVAVGMASAETLHVPSQFPTIQDAINAASDDDVIEIASGNYVVSGLNTGGLTSIALVGQGSAQTVLIADENSPALYTFGSSFEFISYEGLQFQGFSQITGFGTTRAELLECEIRDSPGGSSTTLVGIINTGLIQSCNFVDIPHIAIQLNNFSGLLSESSLTVVDTEFSSVGQADGLGPIAFFPARGATVLVQGCTANLDSGIAFLRQFDGNSSPESVNVLIDGLDIYYSEIDGGSANDAIEVRGRNSNNSSIVVSNTNVVREGGDSGFFRAMILAADNVLLQGVVVTGLSSGFLIDERFWDRDIGNLEVESISIVDCEFSSEFGADRCLLNDVVVLNSGDLLVGFRSPDSGLSNISSMNSGTIGVGYSGQGGVIIKNIHIENGVSTGLSVFGSGLSMSNIISSGNSGSGLVMTSNGGENSVVGLVAQNNVADGLNYRGGSLFASNLDLRGSGQGLVVNGDRLGMMVVQNVDARDCANQAISLRGSFLDLSLSDINASGSSSLGSISDAERVTVESLVAHSLDDGISLDRVGEVVVVDSVIGNILEGPALSMSSSAARIENITIYSSRNALGSGGAVRTTGMSNLLIDGGRFEACSAGNDGGAVYLENASGPQVIRDSVFIGNSAEAGGAIAVAENFAPVTLQNVKTYGNEASLVGGSVYSLNTDLVMEQTLSSGDAAFFAGGGLFAEQGSATTRNATFANADALFGASVYVDRFTIADLSNTIGTSVSGTPAFGRDPLGAVTIGRSLFTGGSDIGDVIDADPIFRDPFGADGVLGTDDDDLRLREGSPAIDAGDNALAPIDLADADGDGDESEVVPFDLGGSARLFDDPMTPDTGAGGTPVVDLGAYEYQGAGLPGCNSADLAEPYGLLDLSDISVFVAGVVAEDAISDLNGDGLYDLADISIFVTGFQAGCP